MLQFGTGWDPSLGFLLNQPLESRAFLAGRLFRLIRENMQLPGGDREPFKCLQIPSQVFPGVWWFWIHGSRWFVSVRSVEVSRQASLRAWDSRPTHLAGLQGVWGEWFDAHCSDGVPTAH